MLIAGSNACIASKLPNLGNPSRRTLPAHQEQKLGKKMMLALKLSMPLVQDPIVNDYIYHLGYQLVSHSTIPSHPFHFFVVRSSTSNAFSLPWGYIGINSGLILKMQSEGELASVLAHEIAHNSQKHIARAFAEQKKLQLSSMGALLAAAILGVKSPNAAAGMASAVTAGGIQHMLNFSRGHEAEADRVGMQILTAAGFDPNAMPALFNRLASENRLNDLDVQESFRTHPVTETRLADAYNHSEQYAPFHYLKNNQEFYLIQARLVVDLTTIPSALLKNYKVLLKKSKTFNYKLRYAYALALSKDHQYKKAKQQINKLIKKYPSQILFRMTKADIELRAGKNKAALADLKPLYNHNSDYYPLIMQYAKTLIKNKKPKTALNILNSFDSLYNQNENLLLLLSEAQWRSGQKAAAYKTRAKVCLLNGRKKAAKEQLKMASKFAKNRN